MNATVRWILIIVGFLVANALAMAFLVVASSTSRAQVIPDYYDRGTHHDEAMAQAERSRALGWQASIAIAGGELVVDVRDEAGKPLDAARVQVTGYPRAHAARTFTTELTALGAGRYRAPHAGLGVHDVVILVERAGRRFTSPVAVEAR